MATQLSIKTRFSPSPTGLMHLGNLRTALFNVLLAKSLQNEDPKATFLLRIEDTDMLRSEQSFSETLMADLKWLDLHWQEGPQINGEYGPYYQSQRLEIYAQYYQTLIENKNAYWCFCTDTELTIARKSQVSAGMAPRYSGTCRHLTPEQIAAKQAKGLKPALRFRIPDHEIIQFDDFIQGARTFAANDIGDFIIQKADGSSSFMFCNAVDDALMKVTHVMRGEDHLTNTPRQLLILKALGLREPLYGHMPLIIGFDGKPLSKRNGSQSIESLREQGYFPLAINNYLSRLGHHFENEHLLTLAELGQHFSYKHIGRSPARFDLAQLNHWQKETVLRQNEDEFWQWIEPAVQNLVTPQQAVLFTQTIKQNVVLPQDAAQWAKQLLTAKCELEEDAQACLTAAGPSFIAALMQGVQMHGDNYSAVTPFLTEKTGNKGKALFMPLRAVVSGRCYGPELVKIFKLMGKELLLQRLEFISAQFN